MKRCLASISVSALALLIVAAPTFAQRKATIEGVPEIPITSSGQQFLKPPAGESLGESVAVATNSKGDVFVFHRSTPTAKLWQFDKNGNFIKEIGRNYYGFEFSHSVRVDKDDNIWTVDEGTNMITKFDPNGKFLMVIGRRDPPIGGAVATRTGPNLPDNNYTFCRPTDVGWDPQGNIFISDGYCNNRVVKFDKEGRFVAKVGSEKAGSGPGEFNLPHGLQVDGQGNVWVADRTNFRYQVLDNNLKPLRQITNLGVGWTICISPGPHQYVFLSNSNPNGNVPGSWAITGEIYKMELDGTVIGKFGHAGKLPPNFQVVHMMDCRDPNNLIVGEIESWRVQKLKLGADPVRAAGAPPIKAASN